MFCITINVRAASTSITHFNLITLSGKTNQIGDSGTALTYNGSPLGGGSALWSSSGGVLEPSPAVNLLRVESQLANNATNVALVVDTLNPWTGGFPLIVRNNGTNIFKVRAPTGNLVVGANSADIWGASFAGQVFEAFYDESKGDPSAMEMSFGATPAGNTSDGGLFDFYINHQGTIFEADGGDGGATRFQIDIDAGPLTVLQHVYVDGKVEGVKTFWLNPGKAYVNDHYLWGTSTNVTSNGLHTRWATNGTDIGWLEVDGTLHAKDFVPTGSAFRTEDTSGASFVISAHDDDIAGAAGRKTFATLQNASVPSLTIAPPSGGTVSVDATTYKAGGASGLTQTNILAIVGVLTNTSIYKAGLLISSVTVP
jgi:hypothetical protein